MRIISGSHRGKVIVPDKHFKARPTTDFAKENLFNIVAHTYEIEGSRVLDLFSGTGSISYEFASRGAKHIVAIEQNYYHYNFIKKTARELGFSNITAFRTDVFIACKKLVGSNFDIIFADPPYDLKNISDIPAAIFNNNLLTPDGIAIIEHSASDSFDSCPNFFDHRHYGSVNFSLFRVN